MFNPNFADVYNDPQILDALRRQFGIAGGGMQPAVPPGVQAPMPPAPPAPRGGMRAMPMPTQMPGGGRPGVPAMGGPASGPIMAPGVAPAPPDMARLAAAAQPWRDLQSIGADPSGGPQMRDPRMSPGLGQRPVFDQPKPGEPPSAATQPSPILTPAPSAAPPQGRSNADIIGGGRRPAPRERGGGAVGAPPNPGGVGAPIPPPTPVAVGRPHPGPLGGPTTSGTNPSSTNDTTPAEPSPQQPSLGNNRRRKAPSSGLGSAYR